MDLYQRTREHFDSGPIPFPKTETGAEIQLLKVFFTESDCRILLALGWVRITAEKCLERLQQDGAPEGALSLDEIRKKLDTMYMQGSVSMKVLDGEKKYCIEPVAVGWYEHHVDFLTPEKVQTFYKYAEQAFPGLWGGDGIGKGVAPQMRVIVHPDAIKKEKAAGVDKRVISINESVSSEAGVARYDDVRRMLDALPENHLYVLNNCICKQCQDLVGEPCKVTDDRRHCMSMGPGAQSYLDRGQGVRITKKEAMAMLEWQIAQGMVLQCGNYAEELREVCACCGCCCGVITRAKKLTRPIDIFHVTHQVKINDDFCEKCGTCFKRCHMEAIVKEGEEDKTRYRVDLNRCIGCGVCNAGCTNNAITLMKIATNPPPKTKDDLVKQRLKERYGIIGYLKFAVKALIGIRV